MSVLRLTLRAHTHQQEGLYTTRHWRVFLERVRGGSRTQRLQERGRVGGARLSTHDAPRKHLSKTTQENLDSESKIKKGKSVFWWIRRNATLQKKCRACLIYLFSLCLSAAGLREGGGPLSPLFTSLAFYVPSFPVLLARAHPITGLRLYVAGLSPRVGLLRLIGKQQQPLELQLCG